MLEFLLIFGLTFVVLAGVSVLLAMGRSPVYRPTEADLELIFRRLLANELNDDEWHFFLSMPIVTDDALESVRRRCVQVEEQFGLRPLKGRAKYRTKLSKHI